MGSSLHRKVLHRPSLEAGNSIDAVIAWPCTTMREYLNSFLLIEKDEEDTILGGGRTRKQDILYAMSDHEIRDILYQKRKAGEDQKCIDTLDRELSFRTGRQRDTDKEDLEKKKAEVSILEVIESYGSIGRYTPGRLVKCMMPDHNDGSPSMSINTKKNYWKCFGCGLGGSQIDFIMHAEGIELKDAIKKFLQF